jgi:hypothetical protein
VDVWNHRVIPAQKKNVKTRVVFPEEPTDVLSCIVGMPENLRVEDDDGLLRISIEDALENASIQINTVDNLTMMEEEVLTIAGSSAEVQLSDIGLDFPYLVLVKLMQEDILKDEVILNWAGKSFND